jgi:hypothetical protein
MRSQWVLLLAIGIVGALAGVLIADRPEHIDTFVLDPLVETAAVITTDSIPVTTSATPSTAPDTTEFAPSTEPQATSPSTPTIVVATTDVATTVEQTTTTTTDAAPSAGQTLARADIRLVLANGDGRFNLVGRNASRLMAAGYVTIDQTDTGRVDATVLYYRPGFDDEAAMVAADLSVPGAILRPLPDTPVTPDDASGDIVVVLGPDSLR